MRFVENPKPHDFEVRGELAHISQDDWDKMVNAPFGKYAELEADAFKFIERKKLLKILNEASDMDAACDELGVTRRVMNTKLKKLGVYKTPGGKYEC